MEDMKTIHLIAVTSLTAILSIGGLSSCSPMSRDYSNSVAIDEKGPRRTFHPSRRTFGSSARGLPDKPEFIRETEAPTRGFHPSRR
jgi:hypothetical protein